jgi:hypothetical protein
VKLIFASILGFFAPLPVSLNDKIIKLKSDLRGIETHYSQGHQRFDLG